MKRCGNLESIEEYLDETLQFNNLQLELAVHLISNDKIVKSDTVQDIKGFNSHFLAAPAKTGAQLVYKMPALKKSFDFLGDDIVELSTENDFLKN